MKHIDRSVLPIPRAFASSEIATARRRLTELFRGSLERRSQSFVERSRAFQDSAFTQDVQHAFNGRCAFCESAAGGTPLRFRPETEAEPILERATSHLYYAWLATSWDNWYWVCTDCRPENHLYFPVDGPRAALPDFENIVRFAEASERMPSWSGLPERDSREDEDNILLDPCVDARLWEHLSVSDTGDLFPLTLRGEATIRHFRLDRPKLDSARKVEITELHTHLAREGRLPANLLSNGTRFPGIVELRVRAIAGYLSWATRTTARHDWNSIVHFFDNLRTQKDWKALLGKALEFDPRVSFVDNRDPGVARPSPPRDPQPASAEKSGKPDPEPNLSRPGELLPRITHLELQNFKSLEHLAFEIPETSAAFGDDGPGAGALLILGENATGKSSILEGAVLCLIQDETRASLDLDPRRLVLDPSYMDPDLKGGPDRATLRARFADGRQSEMTISGGAFVASGNRPDYPVFAYGAFRQYLKHAPTELPPDHYVATLFAGDRLLPNPTRWLLELDPERFAMVARSLRSIFAIEGDYDVIERDDERCYIISHYEHEGVPRRERTPLDIVSSGFRAILAMTCDIMHGLMSSPASENFQSFVNARALVFIDEIEAHLHPRWKIAIMASLRTALPNVTFIVTSHDPLCLRGMASGEVMVLNRVRGAQAQGSELPIFIETLSALPRIEELTIEQLLTADFFQLNSTTSIDTDREYARIADILRRQSLPDLKPEESITDTERNALRAFTAEVNSALPVGDSEVQRIVQEAVAEYLAERAQQTREGLQNLRNETREKILSALRSL